jgi:hypothetical protein
MTYSPATSVAIISFADEDTSFHDAAVAYERHLKNTVDLWSKAGNIRGSHSRTEAENAALFSSQVGEVLKGIMLLRWPAATAEWVKGL